MCLAFLNSAFISNVIRALRSKQNDEKHLVLILVSVVSDAVGDVATKSKHQSKRLALICEHLKTGHDGMLRLKLFTVQGNLVGFNISW